MLAIFLAGPKGDQTLDLVAVIPREKEAIIRNRGLGRKETRYFWVEVDDSALSDEQFNDLANELTSPIEEIIQPNLIAAAFKRKPPPVKHRLIAKSKYRLQQKELEKLDPAFSASRASRSKAARKNYPQKKLTLDEFNKVVLNKTNGRDLTDGH